MTTVIELKSKRNQSISEAQNLLLAGLDSSEKKDKYKKLLAESDELDLRITDLEKIEHYLAKNPAASNSIASLAAIKRNDSKKSRRARLNEAFRNYLRTEQYPEEFRDIFTGSGGSPLIPQGVFPILGEVAKYFAPVLDYVSVVENAKGHPQKFITENDSSDFLTVASEGASVTETDGSYSDSVVNYDLIRGAVTASRQLFDDSNFDLTQLITRAAGKRLGRSFESIITNGVDPASNAAPNNQGLVNAATVGTTTTTLAAGVGMPDLAALVESLDPTYWSKAVFLMSGGTYLTLLKQTDGSGSRFWKELGEGCLWQWPVVINNSLPQTLLANGLPILFADLTTYGVAHTGLGVQVLQEKYIDQFKVGFQLHSRIASHQLSPGGIKALKLAAS